MNPSEHASKFGGWHAVVMSPFFDLTPLFRTYPLLILTPGFVPWAIWWLPIHDSTE